MIRRRPVPRYQTSVFFFDEKRPRSDFDLFFFVMRPCSTGVPDSKRVSQEIVVREIRLMYHLAPDTDLTFLVGREVVQVGIGLRDIIIQFDQSVSVSIMSHCLVDGTLCEPGIKCGIALTHLLGQSVASAEVQAGRHLGLTFGDGTVVVIREDDGPYESYTVAAPSTTIVV